MKPLVLLTLLLAAAAPVAVDITSPWKARNKSQPDASQGAFVAQTLGLDDWVQISWHRPSVKGRDVWNGTTSRGSALVPRDGEPVPWRAGANEATTIEFTTAVRVQGEALAAGRYALFAIPTDGDWTLIFQADADQWGSGRYDESKDTLRVTTTPEEAPFLEWLTFGFDAPGAWSTVGWLHWAEVKVPFLIEVDGEDVGGER